MTNEHIASAFDGDLEEIQAQLLRMGGLVEEAITAAAASLDDLDVDRAGKVRSADQAIDDLEEQINLAAARVIALRQPTAIDLRMILSVIKISADLERIGDHAKNMAKRTATISELPPVGGLSFSLRRMAKAVREMLSDALDAYIRRDAELAEAVINRDVEVDQMYTSHFRNLLEHMSAHPDSAAACTHLHFMAKNTERMGDRVTNIAEHVVYLATGERLDAPRDKGDMTSTDPSLAPEAPDDAGEAP